MGEIRVECITKIIWRGPARATGYARSCTSWLSGREGGWGGTRGNGVFTSGTTCRRGACVGGERMDRMESEKIEGWEVENRGGGGGD